MTGLPAGLAAVRRVSRSFRLVTPPNKMPSRVAALGPLVPGIMPVDKEDSGSGWRKSRLPANPPSNASTPQIRKKVPTPFHSVRQPLAPSGRPWGEEAKQRDGDGDRQPAEWVFHFFHPWAALGQQEAGAHAERDQDRAL